MLPCAQAQTPKFVSLTLCADRLLTAIAEPAQIAALSTFSDDAYAMLQVNTDKPVVRPELSDLIPYADATILLNDAFYPRLAARLQALGFRTINIDDNPQNADALFALMRQLGELTGNRARAEALIAELNTIEKQLRQQHAGKAPHTAMVLADSGVIDTAQAQYQQLFKLLNLIPTTQKMGLNFSAEQLLRANPQVIISQSADDNYSNGARWLSHPLLAPWQQREQDRALAHAPNKYFFCFDHGIWLGAERLGKQLP